MGALVVVAALTVTACNHAEPVDVRDEAQSASRLVPASPDLAKVIEASGKLSSTAGALTRACLNQAGFPQAQQASELVRRVPAQYHPSVLGVVPLETGPSTYDEARAFGFAGTPLAIEEDARGFVISNSEDFDTAADQCFELVHTTFPELASVQTDAADFGDSVRRALVRRLTARLTKHLEARFECVRRAGFPRLVPSAAVQEPSLDRILTSAGVVPGEETSSWTERTREDVPAGQIAVFEPPPPRTYRPSAQEREFADAYVRCGKRQQFTHRLQRAVKGTLRSLERRFRVSATALATRLTELGDEISSTTTLGKVGP